MNYVLMNSMVEIIGIIILGICLLIMVIIIGFQIINLCTHNYLEFKYLYKKDYKIWKFCMENADKFKFDYETDLGIHYSYPEENLELVIWKDLVKRDGCASVHDATKEHKCLFGTFFTRYSLELAAKVLSYQD